LSIISCVGFRTSTQPTNIKQLQKYGFSERNPTNHVAGVSVQTLTCKYKTVLTSNHFFESFFDLAAKSRKKRKIVYGGFRGINRTGTTLVEQRFLRKVSNSTGYEFPLLSTVEPED